MVGSNGFVHVINIPDPLAGVMVHPHPVLGVFVLPALMAEDEVYFCNFAEGIFIGFDTIVQTLTEHCSKA